MPEQQEIPQQQIEGKQSNNIGKRRKNTMKTIDKDVLAKYNAGIEKGRLHKDLGLIEFERTKEILCEMLPPPPAVLYDIGGGYGEYAFWLTSLGYEVHLFDLSEKNIEMAHEMEAETGLTLAAAELADAREINRPNASADAILLFGPLYHIIEREERALCLKECRRLLKPNGLLFTANITCFARLLHYVSIYDKNPIIDDIAIFAAMEKTVKTGINTPLSTSTMGHAYFHRPNELKEELEASGFADVDLRGVIGPCWMITNLDEAWPDPVKREAIMRVVRLLEKEESMMGFSTHFLSISRNS